MNDIKLMGKVFVTLDEIERFYNIREYIELVKLINSLLEKKQIIKVKPKDTNAKDPALCKKYKVIVEKVDETTFLKELETELPPSFYVDYYRNNIGKYIQHQKYILALSDYFKHRKSSLLDKMSYNERSFEIWGEEKFLKDNSSAQIILKNLNLSMEKLNVYLTPEPFFYYMKDNREPQNILIVENKDTWYSMRKLLREGYPGFLGMPFSTIIYGEGKKILHGFMDLAKEPFSQSTENTFYYFGDLDYEGTNIYTELKKRAKDYREIVLFKEAYRLMLELAADSPLPKMKDKQAGKKEFDQFLSEFDEVDQAQIKAIVEQGLYIPQEIVNYQVLKKRG